MNGSGRSAAPQKMSDPRFNLRSMSTFVLIPGAWLGGWVWRPVTSRLRALGHRVHALTLSGVGGSAGDAEVGLATHVRDVLDLLESADVRDGVLVAHSYAGM